MTTNLRRRLLPLYTAAGLQGFMLWTPIEKLFMNEIGFDAARSASWRRRTPRSYRSSRCRPGCSPTGGAAAVSSCSPTSALLVSVLIGGLSHSVGVYILGALMLGVYFAMYSGTTDAIVYDTVLEETGTQ